MANERQKRLMQEALDENLSSEALTELHDQLNQDVTAADSFDRLQQVDRMLRNAPHERAPQRLAANIMAKLAQTLNPQQLSRLSGLALALSLSLVALVMMPLLLGIAWFMLSLIGSATALNGLIQAIVGLLAFGMASLEWFVLQVQTFVAANPEVPLLMIGLIPVSVLWLVRFGPRNRATDM